MVCTMNSLTCLPSNMEVLRWLKVKITPHWKAGEPQASEPVGLVLVDVDGVGPPASRPS